ncbi:hypothetical protein, variant [Verruconis gallopava]|nr:hypothetical protein, variant [Verruconis gallopava]KIW07065.1 hypothetical protein, variant [Verruconis gallopava]
MISTIITFVVGLLHLATAYTTLSEASLKAIPAPGDDFDIKTGSLLAPILQVRVPGTPGIAKVRQHFVDFFSQQLPSWTLSTQNSSQHTALGGAPIDFVNIIATRDPPWSQPGEVGRLTLVAHYDSKLTPEGFIGATDSAAPCAMLLHAAKVLDEALTRKWENMQANGETDGLEGEKGIQILLLDGEEAFVSWSDRDSLYGARALAEAWEQSLNPAMSTYRTPLHEIDLFVLLDLLGSANPRMPSYFKTTHWAYKHMADLESRLRAANLFKSSGNAWFTDANKNPDIGPFMGGMVQDDHLPFMARGVEVLHLIPSPFPSVWHTEHDDGEHLDIKTTEDWAVLTAAFAAEWMDLEGFMVPPKQSLDRRKLEERTEL